MSRMLNALRQIEARSPAQAAPPESASREQLDSPERRRPDEQSPEVEQQPAADEAVRDEAAIEEALSGAEVAAAMAAGDTQLAAASDPPHVKWPLPPSETHARAYAELADNILARFRSDGKAALMFTSPGDGEGKTGTLILLAAALAERTAGEVLLLDGNLRKPAVGDHLRVQTSCGLADVLTGMTGWRQVVRRSTVPRLSVLPGVVFPAPDGRPPQWLNLRPLLAELHQEYQLVLIDTASLAHVEVAPMARCCDGTYLVVRLGQTLRRAVAEAVRVIENAGGRVLGSVVVGG